MEKFGVDYIEVMTRGLPGRREGRPMQTLQYVLDDLIAHSHHGSTGELPILASSQDAAEAFHGDLDAAVYTWRFPAQYLQKQASPELFGLLLNDYQNEIITGFCVESVKPAPDATRRDQVDLNTSLLQNVLRYLGSLVGKSPVPAGKRNDAFGSFKKMRIEVGQKAMATNDREGLFQYGLNWALFQLSKLVLLGVSKEALEQEMPNIRETITVLPFGESSPKKLDLDDMALLEIATRLNAELK